MGQSTPPAIEIRDNMLIIKPEPKLFDLMLGYPTNFIKKFAGGRRNAYHDIHIMHLYFLGKHYDKPRLSQMAEKWKEYKRDWRSHHSYKNLFKYNKVLIDNKFIEQWDKKIL